MNSTLVKIIRTIIKIVVCTVLTLLGTVFVGLLIHLVQHHSPAWVTVLIELFILSIPFCMFWNLINELEEKFSK